MRACRSCKHLTEESICPVCKNSEFSDDFSGIVIMFDPATSVIAKAMNIKEKGRYALKVR